MNQISDKITVIPLAGILSQWGDSLTLKDDAKMFTFLSCSPVIFSQDPEKSEAGLLYSVKITAVSNHKEKIMEFNHRKVVVRLTLTDRSLRLVGSVQVPASVVVTPDQGNNYKVEITCKLRSPVML